jgi:glycosyltransferase involved in cell wall biosynthesis
MRIAEVINNLEIGGAERLLVDLARQLKRRGHSVDVLCLRGQGPLAAPLREAGIGITSFGKSEGLSLGVVRTMAGVLKSRRIDVVHTHNPLVHHYGAWSGRTAGVPAIVNTLHGFGNLDDSRKTRVIYDLSCLFSSRVVCVCRALESHLRKVTHAAGRRSIVIPNGICLDQFTAIHPCDTGRDFVFGAVGRLVPVKDHQTLLRAFALLAGRFPQVRLEILGDGPLRAQLEAMANDLGVSGQVRLVPPTLDVPGFLSRIHTFVICSLTEGLPLTLIEAMAAGLPIIATQVGGMPELVLGAGCGWLARPNNPAELASRMQTAMECDHRPALGIAGRRYAQRFHSLEAMTDGYEQLFENLLEQNKARRLALPGRESLSEKPLKRTAPLG